jgi:hypothetical protein
MSFRIATAVLALLILAGHQQVKSQSSGGYNGFDLVDKTGNIRKPTGYRDHYEALGTYTVFDQMGGGEMHYTYASPGAVEHYRKNGKFADGTVLVKEVFGTDHAKLTTGDAHWASGIKVWFVMIKNEQQRFPNNPLWADGWGWALFNADAPDKQIATDYRKDCWSCHVPAASTDRVYLQGYPILSSK